VGWRNPMVSWISISPSRFPWEREALDFVRQRLPPTASIHVWSNFEFIAENGSIYELDLLCLSPWGVFVVEIKSRPGAISGAGNTWVWHEAGRSVSDENPLLLANRKAKTLKSLLARQRAFSKEDVPFIEPLVFCSHPSNTLLLQGPDAHRVCVRDREEKNSLHSGIIAALARRDCPGLKTFNLPPISTPQVRAFLQAMEQCGIRPVQGARRAGDYKLERLFYDSPTGSYQDWIGRHATVESGPRLIRIYLEHRQSSDADRQTVRRAAEREFQILNRLEHPGILHAETLTTTDFGLALVFRFREPAERLDHFLSEKGKEMPLDQRLDLIRQIAEVLAYAHRRKVIHRALSPQSILVTPGTDGKPFVQIYNWQVSLSRSESTQSVGTRISRSLHAEQLLEDASTVFLAPELLSGQEMDGEELDSFSLGAISYLILANDPPAATALELHDRLAGSGGYLDLRSVVNGVADSLAELIRFTANADRSLRYTPEEVLRKLDEIEEELTAPASRELVDPRHATPGNELLHGLTVERILGSGSLSKVLQVKNCDGEVHVLKVATRSDYNRRLREEFDILNRIRHQNVVAPFKPLEFGEVHGFTMERAGDETLAHRLRNDGKLEIDLLERFGEELLHVVDELDKKGIAHRDIKPDNLGVRSMAKGPLRLILFDFSLASSPPENIQLGTPPYLDPFLNRRKVKRWDAYAERFAAAMTLHEMAAGPGVLPRWGDGKSAPHLLSEEVTIEAELFPAPLRAGMAEFFRKALRRDYQERFDNAEEMREAWKAIFRHVDQPALHAPAGADQETLHVSREDILKSATLETQLILLGLSTRLVNVLDRLGLVAVADLLAFPLIRIHRMRGVGNKTRQEAAKLVMDLRDRFPGFRAAEKVQLEEATAGEEDADTAVASIDLLAKQVLVSGSRSPEREGAILHAFLALDDATNDPRALAWPSQSDLGSQLDVTRARVGQVVTKARERWSRLSSITRLREAIVGVLRATGGVATHEELISAVLHLRGSSLPEPERSRMASVVTRVALETERQLKDSRFEEFRRQERIFVALSSDLADYARRLGQIADRLVEEEPLPTSVRVLESLQKESLPVGDIEAPPLPDPARLVQLAAAASRNACANAKLELYPRGMEARRALILAQSALFGSRELTVEDMRERVGSRYREAERLPDRPALDALITEIGLPLRWDAEACEGKGAYVPRAAADLTISEGTPSLQRARTVGPARPRKEIPEQEAEALRLEEKLRYAERQGSFLVLAVPSRHMERAVGELRRRFDVELLDGDSLFLDALKTEAGKLGVNW
jgi:serine/threonine protein kinase